MERIAVVWDRVEKWAIYAALFSVVVLEFGSMFLPPLSSVVDAHGRFALLALALLLMFRYLDERLESKAPATIIPESSLVQAIVDILGHDAQLSSVDIFANTSSIYYLAFHESRAKVKCLRILLRQIDPLESMRLPTDNKDKIAIRSRTEVTISDWQRLQKSGRIEKLEIEFYPFEPMMHYMLVDRKGLLFGTFSLLHDFPGISPMGHDTFRVHDDSVAGRSFLSDFSKNFDQVWNEFAKPESKLIVSEDS